MPDPRSLTEPYPDRHQIAICIADPANARLLEGIAAQLSLTPLMLSPGDLQHPGRLASVSLLVADEPIARNLRQDAPNTGLPNVIAEPALVAVAASAPDPAQVHQHAYDGLLILPLLPTATLAQLSVILYAHRTNVRRFESALDELALNRRIFRSVTSGISIASATQPGLPLTYVNPAFEVISGYSFEEIQGRNCRFLQGGDHAQPGLVLIREAIREQRKTVAVLKNFRKDGTPFWNELSLSPIFDQQGRLTHFVGIQNDVTERVVFEEALRESEKLATAGRLAASIAHEINNPLEAITNLLYLARVGDASPPVKEYLRQADAELQRVALLTSQSLRFYKQSTKPQAVKPAALVTSVLDVYATKFKNWRIQVNRRDRSAGSVVCFESEIRQVLSNLVRNAMEAMRGAGGQLSVRIRSARNWRTDTPGVAITIADTGHGMSSETRQKLFQAFYSTKGSSGTGLGLWVSREITERHHGSLRLRSSDAPGHAGTVFTLFLPYQAATPEEENLPAAHARE